MRCESADLAPPHVLKEKEKKKEEAELSLRGPQVCKWSHDPRL